MNEEGEKINKAPSFQKLLPVFELLSKAWEVYRSRFWIFAGIALIPAAFGVLLKILAQISFFGSVKFDNIYVPIFLLISVSIISGILSMCSMIAVLYAIPKQTSIREAYTFSFSKVISFLWLSILTGLTIFSGLVLFIVPMIIFFVWFSFANYILIYEDKRGISALVQSKEYVRGYFWPVFLRLTFIMFVSFVLSFILGFVIGGTRFILPAGDVHSLISGELGRVFFALILPLIFIYQYLLYHDIATKKYGMEIAGSKRVQWPFIALPFIGLIFILGIILASSNLFTYTPSVASRDIVRYSELFRLQNAIHKYKIKNGKLPVSLDNLEFKYSDFFRKDPATYKEFKYELQLNNSEYKVCVDLESTTTPACITSTTTIEK